MTPDACPNPDDLRMFVRCSVTEEQADRIAEHLDRCPVCEETVVGLERDGDTVADHFRKAAAAPTFAHEPECQQLLQSLLDGAARPAANTVDLAVDQCLRDYQILAKIGEGGMGAVYKAIHQRLKKTVALKVLPTNRIGDGPAVARFEREMAVLGQLNHPNIVQALDAGEHDGQHYLVMEYVAGSDLGAIVRRCGRLPIADACQVISQAAQGLQYAHEHGFVHRDIKPSNLMLSTTTQRSGQSPTIVKILDLGLARAFDQSAEARPVNADLTTTGQVMGTLDYMAPEQGGDAHEVDIRADIYSLGATLYKLLTGESPYAEHAQKPPLQRLMAIAQQEPPAIRSKRADIPERLATVIHRMLAKKPEQRFATPAEVTQALAPFCAGADLAALLTPQAATRVLDTTVTSTALPSIGAGGNPDGRRRRAALTGFATFLALAAILTITTRHGTVEVTSPDGKLPDDVEVVVSQGGNEIELLQVDNHWSARIVNGEYHVTLRGGGDRFEIRNSQVVVNRMGQTVVTVTLKPTGDASHVDVVTADPVPPQPRESPSIAPAPATPHPDQDKPFVVVDQAGEIRGEYRFITEVLPILHSEEIVEVRGNGPFAIPQIIRNRQALHIRAGQGYRPRFVTSFEMQDEVKYEWFRVDDAALTVEGCDFVGGPGYCLTHFSGAGDTWTFRDCRLIQSYTGIGNLITFSGRHLIVRDSLLANNSMYYTIGFGPPVQVEFENNIVYRGPHALFSCAAQDGFEFLLKRNLFFGGQNLFGLAAGATGRVKVRADENVFRAMHSLVVTGEATEPRNRLEWTGSGNTLVPMAQTMLWDNRAESAAHEHRINAAADWNSYWGNAEDLRVTESFPFPFEIMDLADAKQRATAIGNELTASRGRLPDLPNLGPDMKHVGVAEAYWAAAHPHAGISSEDRVPALEGGPFVLLRNDQAIASFVSAETAIPAAKSGDIIEIRSDGVFPATHVVSSPDVSLTLRAAPGYRPVFHVFSCSAGDWTLEGLHIRQDDGPPQAFTWSARKVVNCIIEGGRGTPLLDIVPPPKFKEAVEIRNSEFPDGLVVRALNVRVENCVVRALALDAQGDGTLECSRCCFWSQSPPRHPAPGSIVKVGGAGRQRVHVSDSLFESDYILAAGEATWQGEHNLYRTHSTLWGSFATPDGKPEAWCRTLDEWRAIWNSDADSQFEESALLRPEMWRRH